MTLDWLLPQLTFAEWTIHLSIFVLNFTLLIFSGPILRLVEGTSTHSPKVKTFRALNILVLLLHVVDIVFLRFSDSYQNYFINIGLSLMTIYAAMFCHSLSSYLSRRRFGTEKDLDGKHIYLDSYSSRLIDLLMLAVIVVTAIYALIKIWGADSLLETTGIFGILAALLAFTSNIWAPDIISGLIILNTQMLEDGDVIVVDGFPDEYIIHKVTLIYVILYDVKNNHRTLVRNSQFTQSKIENLSRLASTDGVRQELVYKIGYPKNDFVSGNVGDDKAPSETGAERYLKHKAQVDKMFQLAFEKCEKQSEIKINRNRSFEWALTDAGDYALEYRLWIFLEKIPNTKVTSTIRRHLMGTIFKVNEAVFAASLEEGVDLSTPNLSQIDLVKSTPN